MVAQTMPTIRRFHFITHNAQREPGVRNIKDVASDYFWKPQAIGALAAMIPR